MRALATARVRTGLSVSIICSLLPSSLPPLPHALPRARGESGAVVFGFVIVMGLLAGLPNGSSTVNWC